MLKVTLAPSLFASFLLDSLFSAMHKTWLTKIGDTFTRQSPSRLKLWCAKPTARQTVDTMVISIFVSTICFISNSLCLLQLAFNNKFIFLQTKRWWEPARRQLSRHAAPFIFYLYVYFQLTNIIQAFLHQVITDAPILPLSQFPAYKHIQAFLLHLFISPSPFCSTFCHEYPILSAYFLRHTVVLEHSSVTGGGQRGPSIAPRESCSLVTPS